MNKGKSRTNANHKKYKRYNDSSLVRLIWVMIGVVGFIVLKFVWVKSLRS